MVNQCSFFKNKVCEVFDFNGKCVMIELRTLEIVMLFVKILFLLPLHMFIVVQNVSLVHAMWLFVIKGQILE